MLTGLPPFYNHEREKLLSNIKHAKLEAAPITTQRVSRRAIPIKREWAYILAEGHPRDARKVKTKLYKYFLRTVFRGSRCVFVAGFETNIKHRAL